MATLKQQRTLEKIVENRGNISKSMREAGYSRATAKNPKNLTQSKSWQELVEEYLPDRKIAEIHSRFLDKIEPHTGQPHSDVLKALDLAYKVKGKYKVALHIESNPDTNRINIDGLWSQIRDSFNKP